MDLMDLLRLARSPAVAKGGRGDSGGTLQGHISYEFSGGGYSGAHGLSLHSLN